MLKIADVKKEEKIQKLIQTTFSMAEKQEALQKGQMEVVANTDYLKMMQKGGK